MRTTTKILETIHSRVSEVDNPEFYMKEICSKVYVTLSRDEVVDLFDENRVKILSNLYDSWADKPLLKSPSTSKVPPNKGIKTGRHKGPSIFAMPAAYSFHIVLDDSGINKGRRKLFGFITYQDMLATITMKERQVKGYQKRLQLDKGIAAKLKKHPRLPAHRVLSEKEALEYKKAIGA